MSGVQIPPPRPFLFLLITSSYNVTIVIINCVEFYGEFSVPSIFSVARLAIDCISLFSKVVCRVASLSVIIEESYLIASQVFSLLEL